MVPPLLRGRTMRVVPRPITSLTSFNRDRTVLQSIEMQTCAAAVTFGGERIWSSAAVNRSMTLSGPPHCITR
jgi:hypothetical protein